MTACIRIATSPGEARIAVVDGNRLLDFSVWHPGSPDGVGDIHRGRVIASAPAMAGAFVALAGAEGFLPDSEGARGLTAGTVLTVRVTRAAQGNKGPRLSATVSGAPANGPVGLVRRGPDPVVRFAALYPNAPVTTDDDFMAAALDLGARVSVVRPAFGEDLATAIDALSRPVVELRGGASLSVWPTPALVAIDVDAGGAVAGAGNARIRHEAVNRAIVPEVAGQIRLRNLSGGIVVDLAGLSPRKRAALGPDFIAALANDPLRPRFLGFTALGLAEIVRSRIHPPLHEVLAGPLAAGIEALRAVMAAFAGNPRALPGVRANPSVMAALQADTAALADLTRRTGRSVTMRSDPSLPAGAWRLETGHG